MSAAGDGEEWPIVSVPRAPELSEGYDIWLSYLRKIERLEPLDHPTLQAARRSTRAVVRRKIGIGPSLESNALKAFSFDTLSRRKPTRQTGGTTGDDSTG